jgi:biotin carboxyl carrier protein
MKYIAEVDELEFPVEILDDHHIRFGGEVLEADFSAVSGQSLYSLILNGESYEGYVYPDEESWQVLLIGREYRVRVLDEREKRLHSLTQTTPQEGEYVLKAPMPGSIAAVLVEEGQRVQAGQILLILESMKMQNEMRTPHPGIITKMRVKENDVVEQKQVLLTVS